MIHKSLRTLPYITALEIIYTGNLKLLSDEPVEDELLAETWAPLDQQFQKLFNGAGQGKIFSATKEIEFLSNKYEIVLSALKSLEFEKTPELLDMLGQYGYRIRDAFYQDDLRRAAREAEGIKVKISQLVDMLPKKSADAVDGEFNEMQVIEQMGAYSAVLGFDFDYNTVSCMKFKSLEHQVKTKIKQIEKQNQVNKKRS